MAKTRSRRRDQKNRKVQAVEDFEEDQFNPDADFVPLVDDSAEFANFEGQENESKRNHASFFGLLDREELEYFKNAESTLAANALSNDDRGAFINSVFEEAKGRELKIVTNQVGSKLFERLVSLADRDQTLALTSAVAQHIATLSSHKFASHGVEAVVSKASRLGAYEAIIEIVDIVQKNIPYMISDKYAAHVLQRIITILGGLGDNVELRSRRSVEARRHTALEDIEDQSIVNATPEIYKKSLKGLINTMEQTWNPSTEGRRLALDTIASPVIQTMVKVSAIRLESYEFMYELVGNENFVDHCLSDPVGSHFLEVVLEVSPRKRVIRFSQEYLPEAKLRKAATGEYSSFVARSLLVALKDKPNQEITASLLPVVPTIVENQKWNLLAEFAKVDKAAVPAIVSALGSSWLQLASSPHFTDLASELLKHSPEFTCSAWNTLADLTSDALKATSKGSVESRLVELILCSAQTAPLPERRRLLNGITPLAVSLSVDASGSHVVDALWQACVGLKFVRERIASLLVENESKLKGSVYGRQVWHNWHLDKYRYKRSDWWTVVKAMEDASPKPHVASAIASAAKRALDSQSKLKRRKIRA